MTSPHSDLKSLLVLVLLVGCGETFVAPSPEDSDRKEQLLVKVVFLGKSGERVALPPSASSFRVDLLMIPGSITGVPTTEDFFNVDIGEDYTFVLDLQAAKANVVEYALASFDSDEGSVLPADTQVARLATTARSDTRHHQFGATGFRDPVTKDALVIIYVDKPSKFTGTSVFMGHEYTMDIEVKEPGYQLIRYREVEKNKTVGTNTGWEHELELGIGFHPLSERERREFFEED